MTFYDLKMEEHSSYFANGVPVHNCGELTKDAQNAALKMFEEAPNHAYFFLATTDPMKLKYTVTSRCAHIKLNPINKQSMEKHIRKVAKAENGTISDAVVERIVETAEGSARQALVSLQKVLVLKTEEQRLNAITANDIRKQGFDLAKLLLRRHPAPKWSEVQKLLKIVDGEPEAIRYIVLGYANSILLRETNPKLLERAHSVVEAFRESFMYSKMAGLSSSCYLAYSDTK